MCVCLGRGFEIRKKNRKKECKRLGPECKHMWHFKVLDRIFEKNSFIMINVNMVINVKRNLCICLSVNIYIHVHIYIFL